MAKNLKDIDKAAESKGSLLVTIWQFVKFIVVSLLAMIVQFVLLNTLQLIPAIQELYKEFLGEPCGHKSHELLHTHYVDRSDKK